MFIIKFSLKWTLRLFVVVVISLAGYTAHYIQTFEPPCPFHATPADPYPCGEER